MHSTLWYFPKEWSHGSVRRDRWFYFSIPAWGVGGNVNPSEVLEGSGSDLGDELTTLASSSHFPGVCHWDVGKRQWMSTVVS